MYSLDTQSSIREVDQGFVVDQFESELFDEYKKFPLQCTLVIFINKLLVFIYLKFYLWSLYS